MRRFLVSAPALMSSALLAPFAAAQVAADVDARIAQLEDPQLRTAAYEQLVELGAAGLPAILLRLQDANDNVSADLLAVLIEIGPAAGAAVPELFELSRFRKQSKADFTGAVVQLAPWRPASSVLSPQSVWGDLIQVIGQRAVRSGMLDYHAAWHRVNARFAFPLEPKLDMLLSIVQQHHPLRVEVAIEHLRYRGPAAVAALPALRRILERPEPRILPTDRTIPLHEAAALAVLAIAPANELAAVARDVLAKRRPPPVAVERAVPQRVRARVDELIADLAVPERRADAAANLVAFGEIAARPVAAVLTSTADAGTVAAALGVLRDLGPSGAAAVPILVDALAKAPGSLTLAVLDALSATLPWSYDHLPSCGVSFGTKGVLRLFGNRVDGDDAARVTAIVRAVARLQALQAVDPASSVGELAALLDNPAVEVREIALSALLAKGAAARPVVPALVTMLHTVQPQRSDQVCGADGLVERAVDRTPFVRRLAAEVIVAAVLPDDPRLPQARAVLAETPVAGSK